MCIRDSAKGMKVIGLTGAKDSKLKDMSDVCIKACLLYTSGTFFASDTSLGNKSGIGAFSIISNTTVIGNNVMMARECIINPSNHKMDDISRPMNQQGFEPVRPVIIDDDVWIRCV